MLAASEEGSVKIQNLFLAINSEYFSGTVTSHKKFRYHRSVVLVVQVRIISLFLLILNQTAFVIRHTGRRSTP